LVWIGSAHSLALGYCRLPTQPCVCFVKLKESFIVKNFGGWAGQLWVRGRAVNKRHSPRSARGRNTSTRGRSFAVHADPRCLGQLKFTASVVVECRPRGPSKDSRDKLVMNTSAQQSEPPAIVVRMSCAPMSSPPAPRLSRPSAGFAHKAPLRESFLCKISTFCAGGVRLAGRRRRA